MRTKAFVAALGATVLAALAATPAGAHPASRVHTSEAAMLTGVDGTTVTPLISVGDTLADGYMFEAIPDGISIAKVNGRGTVGHPRQPRAVAGAVPGDAPGSEQRAVSKLRLQQRGGGVLKGEFAIPASAGYQRFCSNFVVGKAHGFERPSLFTNEEARDIVLAGGLLAPAERPADRGRSGAGRRRRRLRPEERRVPLDLRHGPPQPRERRRRARLWQSGRPLGRRHVRRARLAALPLQGLEREEGLAGQGHALCVRVGRPRDQ